ILRLDWGDGRFAPSPKCPGVTNLLPNLRSARGSSGDHAVCLGIAPFQGHSRASEQRNFQISNLDFRIS
ncbi:MAG TPA: hypothetical protein VK459_02765, partial [Polyangiaceae bacterium]|nr:hypothetical protein [Polyangiaceae bacterium]